MVMGSADARKAAKAELKVAKIKFFSTFQLERTWLGSNKHCILSPSNEAIQVHFTNMKMTQSRDENSLRTLGFRSSSRRRYGGSSAKIMTARKEKDQMKTLSVSALILFCGK